MFQNRTLRRIFGPKREDGEDYTMRTFINCTRPLCLIKHEDVQGSGGIASRILDLGTRRRWVVSFTPLPLHPGTHWISGWVSPIAGQDAVAKGKIPSPSRELNPGTPIFQPVARHYTI
jgi:hypothetical protein